MHPQPPRRHFHPASVSLFTKKRSKRINESLKQYGYKAAAMGKATGQKGVTELDVRVSLKAKKEQKR